jgi:hypothetical protein
MKSPEENSSGKIKRKITACVIAVLVFTLACAGSALAQRDTTEEPTAILSFLVVKDDNGKPVRNAAVIMHPVNPHGKQARGGLELKTDVDGKTSFDGIPYGMLRVQVLASGFQTFGEDYDVNQPKMAFTVKLKRPQGQYSIYETHPGDKPDDKKDEKTPPPTDPNAKPQ